MSIALNSCSAAGQGFYNFFCPGSKSVCLSDLVHEGNFFYRVLHSMIYASHRIGDSSKWIIDIVEKCVRGFTFLIVSKPKPQSAV